MILAVESVTAAELPLWAAGLATFALIAANAFFVAAEFALVSIRKTRVDEMVAHKIRGAAAVAHAVEQMDRSIAAAQLGITVASILLGVVGESALHRLFAPWFAFWPTDWAWLSAHTLATVATVMAITVLHVILGEQVPKVMALQGPDRMALWVSAPLNAFAWITWPLIWLMGLIGNFILRCLGYQPTVGEEMVHSVQELSMLIDDTEEAGLIDEDQADIVQNVFRLSDKRVRDCLVPLEKMAALERDTPPDKVLEAVRQGAHTRMPVYAGTLDNIVGIVNTKDLFYLFSLQGVVLLEDAMYPATFLDPEEDLSNALRLFKKSRRHMALVRDDAGHILGVLTLEDVLEEIVGDLEDEHDRPTPRLRRKPTKKSGEQSKP
jgi:CBS domain containing-hemolysin-like protein